MVCKFLKCGTPTVYKIKYRVLPSKIYYYIPVCEKCKEECKKELKGLSYQSGYGVEIITLKRKVK